MITRLTIFVLALIAVVAPLSGEAKTVVRGGESVSVTDEQAIEHDFYAWGSRVSMSGEVLGDMYSLGGQVAVNGNVQQDLVIVGGGAQVYGAVEDDVRAVAGEAIVAGEVAGDVFVIGGTLTVLSTASVAGDVIFFGGELTVEGAVTGDIQGAMSSVRIDGEVGGVNLSADTVTLGDKAAVKGDVQYKSFSDLVRSPNAQVEGVVVKNTPQVSGEGGTALRDSLIGFVMLAASGLVMLLLLRRPMRRALAELGDYRFDILYGAAFLIFMPLVSVFALSSVLLLPLGLVLLFGYLLTVVFGVVFTAFYTGHLAFLLLKRTPVFNGIEIILGALTLVVLAHLPVVGAIVILALYAAAIGFLLRKAIRLVK
jgi:cytoskeletal protein CcmA (bactofilin family)